ncbi:MAG: adenosylcobinamide-GDP ribazoletransferase [Coriobacteriia bacterium]|nr:adenosylcobinamide-GDP ribazoletransferase [Coriobacteriia bacterium]
MGIRRDIRGAFALLTGVPIRVPAPVEGKSRHVAMWFPLVGIVLGAIPASALFGLEKLNARVSDGGFAQRGALVAGVLVVAFWAWATRLLHWDGLGDVADAVWGGQTPQRRLEIMADPHVGGFGAAAIALIALTQAASIGAIVAFGVGWKWVVLAAPASGRLSATFAAVLGKPAKQEGLGHSVAGSAGGPTTTAVMLALSVATAVAAWVPMLLWAAGDTVLSGGVALHAAIALGVLVCALAVPRLLARPFGGVTGDVMGASVLLTETACLAVIALLGAW